MKKVLIWGTGTTSNRVIAGLFDCEILGFLDNDKSRWGETKEGYPILGNETVLEKVGDFDEIIICSLGGYEEIRDQLLAAGVSASKINGSFVETMIAARRNFIVDYSRLYSFDEKKYDVAEGGVYQGELSEIINKVFINHKLYLFDTFEGFVQKDIETERNNSFSEMGAGHLDNTSEEMVLARMIKPENVIIRKGYFPDTAKGLEEKKFCFVSLDFDLYNPTLAGLRFFWPRLVDKGVILVHDYYSIGYKGVKKAIEDFLAETDDDIRILPIGDHCSIAIIK